MKRILIISLLSVLTMSVKAQTDFNPFESIGKKGKMLTLSNGKYIEVEMYDSLQSIGSVIMNMNTGKIYKLLPIDTVYSEATLDPTVISRWYSVDNVVKPELSPYQFASNNPIIYVDHDGNDEFYYLTAYTDKRTKKTFLQDGNKGYLIPQWNYRTQNHAMHTYWFKTGEEKYLEPGNEYNSDGTFNYQTRPTFIQINSPMTIKGGDVANNGFNKLADMNMDNAFSKVSQFVSTVKPSATIMDVNKMLKVIKESHGGGLLDFKQQLNLEENTLYNINGVYYNKNEAGNFFYGYALAQMNFSYADAEFIAHQGTQMLGGNRKFDEPWELDAIKDGFNFFLTQQRACGDNECATENVDMYSNPNTTKK